MEIGEQSRPRILITDDDQHVRAVLVELLADDYACVAASSAEEALAQLRAGEFAVVLSDITMGGISGLELIPQVLALAPETVVVMISGEQNIERAIEAMRVGAFDYLTKPFDLRHVEAAVRRALQHHELLVAQRYYENFLEETIAARTAERDRLAYHDAVTDLPNRALFEDNLTQSLTLAQLNGQQLAVMFLALDRFKKFNDTLGHATSDLLLRAVAERLTACVRLGDTVARFEGDEFSLLLTRINSTDDAAAMARRLQEALKAPLRADGQELYVTASIGIGLYPEDGADTRTLLKNAGAALYRAKQQGGNSYRFYTPSMNERALQRLALENDLRRALERREFVVHYQPQVNGAGRITCMEALVRWQHPGLGLLAPGEFIPLAEDTGLIVPLGEWVLRAACAQLKSWQAAGHAALQVAVNLSPRQFQQPDLVALIVAATRAAGIAPGLLELEVTEGSLMVNVEQAIATLRELQGMGIQIAIDDFGAGYSSLSYLKHLPVNVLKIDRSFVRDLASDPHDAAIVMAIINLAHSLNFTVKAEGVETEEQMRFLRLLRCDEMQGDLFSQPLPAAVCARLLQAGGDLRAAQAAARAST